MLVFETTLEAPSPQMLVFETTLEASSPQNYFSTFFPFANILPPLTVRMEGR